MSKIDIRSYYLGKGYSGVSYGDGYATIPISNFPDGMTTNHLTIDIILTIADEYRRCKRVFEKYKDKAGCSLNLDYLNNPKIYLRGENITQQKDLEVMAEIKDELLSEK